MNRQLHTQEDLHADRKYKDRLFRLVFSDKKDLLDLYNAVNGTDYDNPEELEVNTLENVLYLSMKNDLSFLIDTELNLYEHQSTCNPNMPMRGFLYFGDLYSAYIALREINLYSSTAKRFPLPQHIVFYNGTRKEPDRKVLRLSDLFEQSAADKRPCLECETLVLNINYGHNRELMEKCRRLEEYAIFVDMVRKNLAKGAPLEEAVTRAADTCIDQGILEDLLKKQKAEVVRMALENYDLEKYEKAIKKESYEEGQMDGYKRGHKDELEHGICQLITALQKFSIAQEDVLQTLQEKYDLSEEKAEEYMKKYW